MTFHGQDATQGSCRDAIALSDGNVVFHGFVDPRATDNEDIGASEVIKFNILSVFVFLRDAIVDEGREHQHRTNGVVASIENLSAILGCDLSVFSWIASPGCSDIGKGSFHFLNSFQKNDF